MPDRGVRTGPWSAALSGPTGLNRLVHRFEALGDRLRSFAQPWEIASFLWVPGIALGFAGWWEIHSRSALQDFGIFRRAALEVVHGHSPYVTPSAAAFSHFDKFVYPPVAALFFAPFAALPAGAARVVMFLAGLIAILAALRLLGVADWRCYSVAIISAPAINTLALGALTSFLLLGVSLLWRFRDNAWVAGIAAAFAAVLKLFLWPLGVWLVATRRWRASAICGGAGVVLLLGGWAVIDFAGFHSYPTVVHLLEKVEAPASYSTIALLGLSGGAETAVPVVLSLAVTVAVWFAARGASGSQRALAVAIIASLLVTPLVWMHYLLLLFVPIALYRPRLSGLWFVPLVLWATPTTHSHGTSWRIALALAVVAIVAIRSVGVSLKPALSRGDVAPRPATS
jgi:alpha-1,2-mannosyltransferase